MIDLNKMIHEELDDLIDQYKVKDTVGYVVGFEEDHYFWDKDSKSLNDSKNLPYNDGDMDDAIKFAKEANPFDTFEEAMSFLKRLEQEISSSETYTEFYNMDGLGVYATIPRTFTAMFAKRMRV